ncbi:MAG: glycosyltransferase family 4 protein [Nitrososphaerota archaeon]|jgi:glycosyltransferase involved in cell wall biosynthesis|nr:glycosyltransferase family 4 protein [Nitrososphaerota archaeon]
MNILIFHWRFKGDPDAGGAENLLYSIVEEMAARGNKIMWCSPKSNNILSSGPEMSEDIQCVRVGGMISSRFLLPFFLVTKGRNFKPDILIDSITGFPWFIPIISRRRSMAIIYHLGRRDTIFTELRSMLGSIGYFPAAFVSLGERLIPKIYRRSRVLTFSEDTKRDLVRSGIQSTNVSVAQEGIFVSRYSKAEVRFSSPTVVYIGRLVANKGLTSLLFAMRSVIGVIPNVRLNLIGRGYLRPELERLAKELGIEANISFLGFVPESEKIKLLGKSHLLVLPSIREGWGTPIIEANACGVVAIGTDTEGIRSTILDGRTGFLFCYGDTKRMAELMLLLLQDEVLRQKLERQAIEWASNFDIKNTINVSCDVITRSCSSGRNYGEHLTRLVNSKNRVQNMIT